MLDRSDKPEVFRMTVVDDAVPSVQRIGQRGTGVTVKGRNRKCCQPNNVWVLWRLHMLQSAHN